MRSLTILLLSGIIFSLLVAGCSSPKIDVDMEKEVLSELLNDFLHGASVNDFEMHNRFWAEDLIYTSSSGVRYGKATIMESMSEDNELSDADEVPEYSAEDVEIRIFGNTAVVAFQLVAKSSTSESEQVMNYLNSGTFVKRDGEWRAVNWQATIKAP